MSEARAEWHPDANTTLYGILGHPVRHSLSPAMHNAAFRQQDINAVYLAFDVTDLRDALKGVKALHIKGLSVTIPHKEEIIAHLDHIDPVASRIGAVNTVVNRQGILHGYNTDWIGAIAALEEVTTLQGKKALVLGAGGSARAVCMGLREKHCAIHIANRTRERAERLASECGASWSGLDGVEGLEADILINTTSVGMSPNEDAIPVQPDVLSHVETVMDLVYSPAETRLLREARTRDIAVVSGLRMLLHQAAAQFELWTGRSAPADLMEQALQNGLSQKA